MFVQLMTGLTLTLPLLTSFPRKIHLRTLIPKNTKTNSMWDVGFFHNWQAKAPHAKTSSSASPTPSPYKCKLSFYLVLKWLIWWGPTKDVTQNEPAFGYYREGPTKIQIQHLSISSHESLRAFNAFPWLCLFWRRS